MLPTAEALSAAAAELFADAAAIAIRERGRFCVALAGGQTPRRLYQQIATPPAARIEWPRVHVFFGDERPVPPDHPESNYHMAAESLLHRVPVPDLNVHRFRGELPPETAAADYERELQRFFALADDAIPRFDLMLLGLGADGHTASLFPGTDALRETRRLVSANWVPSIGHHRLTLTLPVLNAARQVVFVVAGADKARAVKAVLAHPSGQPVPPAAQVRPFDGDLAWLLDAPAAAEVEAGSEPAQDSAGR